MGFIKELLSSFVSEDKPNYSNSLGRNDPCWCGSGKKYKKCHLDADERKRSRNFGLGCGST